MKKQTYFLIIIFLVSAFLRFYRLSDLMPFIGDQGWFYLSARDLVFTGNIPLVGITSSYTWLHQGALWTYMLAPFLWLFKFNPIAGGYLSAALGVLTVFAMYFVVKELFGNKHIGIISALLYATSPLAIQSSRMPYHTSPVPVIILFFIFSINKYAKGNKVFLPISAFLLSLLYSFVLATMVFWILLVAVILMTRRIDIRIAVISLISFLIPLIPMIIYDLRLGEKFYQITAFLRISALSLSSRSVQPDKSILNASRDLLSTSKEMVFVGSELVSVLIILGAMIYLFRLLYINYKKKRFSYPIVILFLSVFLPIAGMLGTRTVSGAYLPILLPGITILLAFCFGKLAEKFPNYQKLIYFAILIVCLVNVFTLISTQYFSTGEIIFSDRLKIAKEVVISSSNRKYNLFAKGTGSEFESITNNYDYLTWWLGNEPSKGNEKLVYTIEEADRKILLNKWQKK